MKENELILLVVKAFQSISNDNYLELMSSGEIELTSTEQNLDIIISKTTVETVPLFLNIKVVKGSDKFEIDLAYDIIIDMCNRFGLMDEKLDMKFRALISDKSTFTIDGEEYTLA